MKLELAGGAVNAFEELEEVKCLKVDPAQIAFVYSSHISSTVERAKTGLQNEGRIIGTGAKRQRTGALQNLADNSDAVYLAKRQPITELAKHGSNGARRRRLECR